jgi:hypothetical protein
MRSRHALFVTIAIGAASSSVVSAAPFLPGDLAVLQAASSSNNTTATIVELSPTVANQTPTNPIGIDGTGANALRFSGSATSTGYLSHTADGSYLTFNGANNGTTTGNVNTLNPRGVGLLNSGGLFSLPTTYTGTSGNQTRSATSLDNSTWYIADQGGLYTNGATTASPAGNLRSIKPFGGSVYVAQQSGTATTIQVSTISAPSGGTITGLPGLTNNASLQDFYLISSGSNGAAFDELYVLDNTSATAGSIDKYSLVGGNWTSNGSAQTTFGGFGLAADKEGTGAGLYLTTGAGATAANSVMRLIDTAGYNAAINIDSLQTTTLYTAAAGTTMKGIDFAPVPEPTGICAVGALSLLVRRKRA